MKDLILGIGMLNLAFKNIEVEVEKGNTKAIEIKNHFYKIDKLRIKSIFQEKGIIVYYWNLKVGI